MTSVERDQETLSGNVKVKHGENLNLDIDKFRECRKCIWLYSMCSMYSTGAC